jgi:hypothetical protein
MYIKLVGTFQNGVYYPETTYTWGLSIFKILCMPLFIYILYYLIFCPLNTGLVCLFSMFELYAIINKSFESRW